MVTGGSSKICFNNTSRWNQGICHKPSKERYQKLRSNDRPTSLWISITLKIDWNFCSKNAIKIRTKRSDGLSTKTPKFWKIILNVLPENTKNFISLGHSNDRPAPKLVSILLHGGTKVFATNCRKKDIKNYAVMVGRLHFEYRPLWKSTGIFVSNNTIKIRIERSDILSTKTPKFWEIILKFFARKRQKFHFFGP